jgi:hypothetical protein
VDSFISRLVETLVGSMVTLWGSRHYRTFAASHSIAPVGRDYVR